MNKGAVKFVRWSAIVVGALVGIFVVWRIAVYLSGSYAADLSISLGDVFALLISTGALLVAWFGHRWARRQFRETREWTEKQFSATFTPYVSCDLELEEIKTEWADLISDLPPKQIDDLGVVISIRNESSEYSARDLILRILLSNPFPLGRSEPPDGYPTVEQRIADLAVVGAKFYDPRGNGEGFFMVGGGQADFEPKAAGWIQIGNIKIKALEPREETKIRPRVEDPSADYLLVGGINSWALRFFPALIQMDSEGKMKLTQRTHLTIRCILSYKPAVMETHGVVREWKWDLYPRAEKYPYIASSLRWFIPPFDIGQMLVYYLPKQ